MTFQEENELITQLRNQSGCGTWWAMMALIATNWKVEKALDLITKWAAALNVKLEKQ